MYAARTNPSPFKGEAGRGMGYSVQEFPLVAGMYPIPTPALPLKGREKTLRSRMAAAAHASSGP